MGRIGCVVRGYTDYNVFIGANFDNGAGEYGCGRGYGCGWALGDCNVAGDVAGALWDRDVAEGYADYNVFIGASFDNGAGEYGCGRGYGYGGALWDCDMAGDTVAAGDCGRGARCIR